MDQQIHRFKVLLGYRKGLIDREQVKSKLGVTDKVLAQITTIWWENLPTVVRYIDKMLIPTNTKSDQAKIKEELAEKTGITVRQVNRLLTRYGIVLPKAKSTQERVQTRENAQKHRVLVRKAAISVIAGSQTAVDAAEFAGVTRRQIYRIVGAMCAGEGFETRDLRHLTLKKRLEIAQKLEKSHKIGAKYVESTHFGRRKDHRRST